MRIADRSATTLTCLLAPVMGRVATLGTRQTVRSLAYDARTAPQYDRFIAASVRDA